MLCSQHKKTYNILAVFIARWWLNGLKNMCQGQKTQHTKHPLMLAIICAIMANVYSDLCTMNKISLIIVVLLQNYSFEYTMQWRYNAVNFLTIIHKWSPIARPFGRFVDPDWYSASVIVIIYVISYIIGPHYNGTRLYWSRWKAIARCHPVDQLCQTWKESVPKSIQYRYERSQMDWLTDDRMYPIPIYHPNLVGGM